MRKSMFMGQVDGSTPSAVLSGTATKADIYKMEVTTAGLTGVAKIAVTSTSGTDDVAEALVTSGTPFQVGTSGVYITFYFSEFPKIGDFWNIETYVDGTYRLQGVGAGNYSGAVHPISIDAQGNLLTAFSNKSVSATILNTASKSDVIDVRGFNTIALMMPAAWTAADIGLLHSTDPGDASPQDMVDTTGSRIKLTNLVVNTTVEVTATFYRLISPAQFIWIESIDTGDETPEAQGAERIIIVLLGR